MISTPESGVDSIAVSWAMLDPLMTVIRPVAGFITAVSTGIAQNFFGNINNPSAKFSSRANPQKQLTASKQGST
jgi:uncharacterized membrane protein YraQ (UPF0718 family)